MRITDTKEKREKKKRDPITTICVLSMLLLIYALTFMPIHLQIVRVIPLFNAMGKNVGGWPAVYRFNLATNEKTLRFEFDQSMYKGDGNAEYVKKKGRAFALMIENANEFFEAHPKYFLIADDYSVEMTVRASREFMTFSKAKGSDRIDCLDVTYSMIEWNGCEYLREMRSLGYIIYDDTHKGNFFEIVGDLTVLENLERIGPASNFSEQELAWFAENLPECEVVE